MTTAAKTCDICAHRRSTYTYADGRRIHQCTVRSRPLYLDGPMVALRVEPTDLACFMFRAVTTTGSAGASPASSPPNTVLGRTQP